MIKFYAKLTDGEWDPAEYELFVACSADGPIHPHTIMILDLRHRSAMAWHPPPVPTSAPVHHLPTRSPSLSFVRSPPVYIFPLSLSLSPIRLPTRPPFATAADICYPRRRIFQKPWFIASERLEEPERHNSSPSQLTWLATPSKRGEETQPTAADYRECVWDLISRAALAVAGKNNPRFIRREYT